MTPDSTPTPQPKPAAAPAPPAWLPPFIPFGGDWNVFVRALYIVFERDFKNRWPNFRTFPVWHNRRVDPDDDYGFEEGFWHLVTRDQMVYNRQTRRDEKERLPDLDRAGRLPWAKPIIEHETAVEMLAWDFDEATKWGTVVRTYVWLKDRDYVVILERQQRDRGDVFMLVTSFLLDFEGKRRDLQSRYERRRK
ncbi:MAG: hypothetical protein HYY24_21205 [Verrucomicrobia bacterium]|nr:hypothetical protein [Verrucomicrobiota bacterium]